MNTSLLSRIVMVLASLACCAAGAALAYFHPLAPLPLLVVFGVWVCAAFIWPALWAFVLPALLPVVGLASWTGWFTFEEFDILVLGAAAGGYLRLALAPPAERSHGRRRQRVSVIALGILLLFSISLVIALQRGFADAGGFHFGWLQGYDDSMNSLRLFKSFFLALLLAPLALREIRIADSRLIGLLSGGMSVGLGLAGLACLWERTAFLGALDFSSDYRTTALFWEMHVGGAALDGFLGLTVPFAIRETLRAKSPARLMVALLFVALAVYACLTTFSRGVYLGGAVALGLLVVLLYPRSKAQGGEGAVTSIPQRVPLFKLVVLMAGANLASFLAFRTGGYRALLAVLGGLAITLQFGRVARDLAAPALSSGLVLGAILGALATGSSLLIPKSGYLSFAAAFCFCLALRWWRQGKHGGSVSSTGQTVPSVAGYCWLLVSALLVAHTWGGQPALLDMSMALTILCVGLFWHVHARQPLWPDDIRAQGMLFGVALLLSGVIAVFGGGAYMSERFSTSQRDFGGRLQHWSDGVDLLQSQSDWLFGKGLGRFPATYFFSSRTGEFPGGYHLQNEEGNNFLRLSGPKYAIGFGEYLRVAQRVPVLANGQYLLEFDVRANRDAVVQLEICEKHLLYRAGCATGQVRPKPGAASALGASSWQHFAVPLDGKYLSGGPWYAPRLAFFSIALETAGAVADVDNVSLIGDGRNLLANGNFSADMSRWFFTSDHHHLPWHIKNVLLNVLFDQGVLGLLLFMALVGGALWRLLLGGAREHAASPYLASALVWFLVVGGFDSLLDVPRVAFLFYLLVLLSLMLNGPAVTVREGTSAPHHKASSRSRSAHR